MERSGSMLSLQQTQELRMSLSSGDLMNKYGRMWVWEGYYDPDRTVQWLDAVDKLKSINSHVIQDIEDHILLHGFKGKKPLEIKRIIEID